MLFVTHISVYPSGDSLTEEKQTDQSVNCGLLLLKKEGK